MKDCAESESAEGMIEMGIEDCQPCHDHTSCRGELNKLFIVNYQEAVSQLGNQAFRVPTLVVFYGWVKNPTKVGTVNTRQGKTPRGYLALTSN